MKVVKLCRQKGIRVALSNPCFDLWLLLHFAEFPTEASLTCEDVGDRLRAMVGHFNKTKVYNLPINNQRVRAAIGRSKANHDSSREIPTQLQTSMHLIIEDLVERGIISIPE